MTQWEKASNCLERKISILRKLAANTETQYRFIQKRKMKGLKRVLKEREGLIQEFAAIDEELSGNQTWKTVAGAATLLQEISCRQKELLERSQQVLQQAITEKSRIAAELRGNRTQRQVHHKYFNSWTIMAKGRRINAKC